MRPVEINVDNPREALLEIQRASHDADITEIAQNFTVDNPAFTEALTLNTTAPTVQNLADVLATLLTIMQKGGLNRST